MPRQSRTSSARKHFIAEKEESIDLTSNSTMLMEEDSLNDISSEDVETDGTVEVIHWIPASAGSVIQIPGGKGSQHFSIQLHQNGQVVEVPVFHSDMVSVKTIEIRLRTPLFFHNLLNVI